jgi:hypothetical protein
MQIADCLTVAVQLHAIETCSFVQQRWQAAPLVQQSQGLRELHLVVEFGETNDVTTAAAAVTIEQILVGVNEKAGLPVGVQRTQSQKAAEADRPGLLPIVSLQVLQ